MKRLLAILVIAAAVRAADVKPLPATLVEALLSPAAAGAAGASLFTAPDATVWISWVEPAGNLWTLKFSTFDAAAKKWRAPRAIATDASLTSNAADFPQLVVNAAGEAVAIWADGHGGARLSQSHDRGVTWSAPARFPRDGDDVEKFSLAVLADGRLLVAWLDGRLRKSGGKMQALYAHILGENTPDTLVDPAVCDCCQTTLTPFLDGGALLAYRARTDEEVRDIRTARFDGRTWRTPRPLNNDDWRINACPVNGPKLASDGGRVAAAWFTAADSDPRVLASYSPDAGARFLMPLRIDRGHPTGHVDTAILHDGALLVTWLEQDGSLWLRRVSPDFTSTEPVALAPAGAVPIKAMPRMALVRDYAGAKTAAQLVVAYATEGKQGTLETLLLTVPEGELVEAEKNCDCAPTAEQLLGFPIRATLVSTAPDRLRARHPEVPGVLASGEHEFRIAAGAAATVPAGRQFLGRIERRTGEWWLYDVRLLTGN